MGAEHNDKSLAVGLGMAVRGGVRRGKAWGRSSITNHEKAAGPGGAWQGLALLGGAMFGVVRQGH